MVVITGATLIITVYACIAVPPTLSLSMIVKVYVPAVVGVPEMMPVTGASERPTGNVPTDTDQVNGDVPPVIPRVWLYDSPTSLFGSVRVVITKAGLMVIINGLVAVAPILSVTMIVKLKVPAVVGVPAIAPVDGVRVSPAGSKPVESDQVYGTAPPIAVRV